MSLSVTAISTFTVGVPSVIVASASYIFATRAHREAMITERDKVGVAAFATASKVYESAIAELRRQVADLTAEVARLTAELAQVRAELAAARGGKP